MPPRPTPNPAPITASARTALKSFYCELCQKGYSRMNEFDAHESSYDHQHKKRLRDMKNLQKDPSAVERARKAEKKADEKGGLITIKPLALGAKAGGGGGGASGAGGTGGGFKKGGFKNAFGKVGSAAPGEEVKRAFGEGDEVEREKDKEEVVVKVEEKEPEEVESETDEEDYYDPRKPTDCHQGCRKR